MRTQYQQRTDERRNFFRQANSSAPVQAFAQSERALRYTAPTRTSDQTARLPTSFFSRFFFLAKKKWERFPFPKVFVKLLSIEKINTETKSSFFVYFHKKINALTDSEKNLAYLQKMWYNIKYSVEQLRNLPKI